MSKTPTFEVNATWRGDKGTDGEPDWFLIRNRYENCVVLKCRTMQAAKRACRALNDANDEWLEL